LTIKFVILSEAKDLLFVGAIWNWELVLCVTIEVEGLNPAPC